MKKFIILSIMMLICTISVFAQVVEPTETPTDYTAVFSTFAALVAFIPIVVEFIKKLFKTTSATNSLIIQISSWVIGIVITMVGWYFKLGFLDGVQWYFALLWGVAASLAANGIADTQVIKAIFSLFTGKK